MGGQDEIVPIARYIWERYEAQLKASGDLYYTWQYDIRWAAQKLQDSGTLLKTRRGARSIWKLT
nr:hypothetical protein [Chelatococcus asaccharovorans]